MKKFFVFIATILLILGCYVQAQAEPIVIGSASYDSNSDGTRENYNLMWTKNSPFGSIVWLDYSPYGTWENQGLWAIGLNIAGILIYNINPIYSVTWSGDWRLPSTVDGVRVHGYDGTTTAGYNITSSEMGHLFYVELGNKGEYDTSGNYLGAGNCLTHTGEFKNLIAHTYWSGTEYTYDAVPNNVWALNFDSGSQDVINEGLSEFTYALAVRTVDVTAVPEPATMLLLGTGLLGLIGLKRKYRA